MESFDFSFLVDSKIKKDIPMVISIGVFESFHNGHKEIIRNLIEEKKKYPGAESMVITFSINPKPGRGEMIDSLRLREENLAIYEIDTVATIDFCQQFSRISASGFLQMLLSAFSIEAIVVGEDFRFGSPQSSANAFELVSMLREFGSSASVKIVAPILMEGGEKISSTLLRRMIKEGRLSEFLKSSDHYYTLDLLESPYAIESDVLVFNAKDIHQLLPPQGAYDSTALFDDGTSVHSCFNVMDDFVTIKLNDSSIGGKCCPKAKIEKLLLERKRNDFS